MGIEVSMSVGAFKMMFGPTKGEILCHVITHNIILDNQKTELFMYDRQCAHATFDVTNPHLSEYQTSF